MKTNVSETSISSIHEHRAQGKSATQRQAIVECLSTNLAPMTRREISVQTGIEPGAVAGRVNGLIKDGVLVEPFQKTCPVTSKKVWAVELAKLQEAA